MSKILVIGNSAAGFSCCEVLAKNLLGYEITVISEESFPAYKRNLLIDYLNGSVKTSELFLSSQCPGKNINLLLNAKVVSVDPKKNRVVLKDNTKINFDYLIIASGEKANIPDMPGKTKGGIFTVYNLEEVNTIKQLLITAATICIIGEPVLCLRLWGILTTKDKEVKIISSTRPDSFVFSEKSEWIENLEVVEFIGEGSDLKAIKLNNGKIIGTSLVLFVGQRSPSTEFLKDSRVKTHNGCIIVDELMRTNLENIFACGSVCRIENLLEQEKSWVDAAREGVLAAQNLITLLGKEKISCQQNF